MLRQLVFRYRSKLEEMLRAEGLTLVQLRLLKAIRAGSDLSAAALARRSLVTPQALQAMLAHALREEWITGAYQAAIEGLSPRCSLRRAKRSSNAGRRWPLTSRSGSDEVLRSVSWNI